LQGNPDGFPGDSLAAYHAPNAASNVIIPYEILRNNLQGYAMRYIAL
jgi:hypothetical protein